MTLVCVDGITLLHIIFRSEHIISTLLYYCVLASVSSYSSHASIVISCFSCSFESWPAARSFFIEQGPLCMCTCPMILLVIACLHYHLVFLLLWCYFIINIYIYIYIYIQPTLINIADLVLTFSSAGIRDGYMVIAMYYYNGIWLCDCCYYASMPWLYYVTTIVYYGLSILLNLYVTILL